MASIAIRVTPQTYEAVRQLAAAAGLSIQEVLARAVESYRRARILRESNAAYEALRTDLVAWHQHLDERVIWDATLLDGLETR